MFGFPFVACAIISFGFSWLGLHVIRREIIFIDIAFAQIIAAGAIAAHVLFGLHHDSLALKAIVMLCVAVASLFFALVRRQDTGLCLEAVIGISYALAAALALFLVGNSPGGHTHIFTMLSGSILWIKPEQLATLVPVIACMIGVALLLGKSFAELSQTYETGNENNLRSFLLDVLFYLVAGTVIAVAVNAVGVVLVFTLLIFPATTSVLLVEGWVKRWMLGWTLSLIATLAGMLFASRLDFSVGPSIALMLGIIVTATSAINTVKRQKSG
jgi:zinc/manganese transport system permease protein